MWSGAPLKAYGLLFEGAAAEGIDRAKAARMLGDAAWASCIGGEITNGLEAARRACELAEKTDDVTSIVAGSTLGLALLLRGRANEAMPYLERYQVLLDQPGPETRAFHLLRPVGQVLTWLERYEQAHQVFDEMVERARSESALGALPYALAGKSEVDFRIGNWPAAYAGASEAVRIAEDTDQRTLLAFAFHVRERGLGEPNVLQWSADLIEAYVRAGHEPEAEAELELLERQAAQTGRTWALAAAARCRGLLVPEGQLDDAFNQQAPTPFERARTELCYGERLRRAKRRTDAREPLHAALETFERLGARGWAERAAKELAATGITAKTREPSGAETLTPQELQVALTVARGATNREAGTALFLSPKTVESHLSRIYRKLNVRSRTELAHQLSSGEFPVPASA